MSYLADLATVIAMLVAIIAAGIALWSYLGSASQARKGSMNDLFRDYLRARLDYELDNKAKPKEVPWKDFHRTTKFHLISMKLYALEEMHNWYDDKLPAWRNPVESVMWFFSKRRKKFLGEWRSTIKSHLTEDYKEIRMMLLNYTECYSLYFLRFVAEHWHRDDAFRDYICRYEEGHFRQHFDMSDDPPPLADCPTAKPWLRTKDCRDGGVKKVKPKALGPCTTCGPLKIDEKVPAAAKRRQSRQPAAETPAVGRTRSVKPKGGSNA